MLTVDRQSLTGSERHDTKPRKCNQCVMQPVADRSQNTTQQADDKVTYW